jgi:hypothetical protein
MNDIPAAVTEKRKHLVLCQSNGFHLYNILDSESDHSDLLTDGAPPMDLDLEAAAISSHGAAVVDPIVKLIPPTPEKLPATLATTSTLAPPTPHFGLHTRSRSKTRSPSPGIQLDVPPEVRPLRRSPRSRSGTPRP